MKYTKMSNKLGSIVLGILMSMPIIFILVCFGGFVYLDFYLNNPLITLLWIMLLPTFGLGINWFIGHYFGDEYYNTGWVYEGRSVFDVVKTPKYYRRRMYLCIIECVLFVLLIIRFLSLMLFTLLGIVGFWAALRESIVPLLGIVGCIIAIIIYYIVGKSSYELSADLSKEKKQKNKLAQKSNNQEIEKLEPKIEKPEHLFKFEKYPELLEKYNKFKLLNFRKYTEFDYAEDKKQALEEIGLAFEDFAQSVFSVFNEIKPDLIVKKTLKRVKWDDVINKPYQQLSYKQKQILIRLLDRLYLYLLPAEYYNL